MLEANSLEELLSDFDVPDEEQAPKPDGFHGLFGYRCRVPYPRAKDFYDFYDSYTMDGSQDRLSSSVEETTPGRQGYKYVGPPLKPSSFAGRSRQCLLSQFTDGQRSAPTADTTKTLESNRQRANQWIAETAPDTKIMQRDRDQEMWIQLSAERRRQQQERTKLLRNMKVMPFDDWHKEWQKKKQNQQRRKSDRDQMRATLAGISDAFKTLKQDDHAHGEKNRRSLVRRQSTVKRSMIAQQNYAKAVAAVRRSFAHTH